LDDTLLQEVDEGESSAFLERKRGKNEEIFGASSVLLLNFKFHLQKDVEYS
jgi:hypothetical protein